MGMRMSSLYRQQQLAIAILDVAEVEKLTVAIDWYLENLNFSLHVVTLAERFDQYNLGEKYPDATFILFKNLTSVGEQINAIANVSYASYFMVVRSDTQLVSFDGEKIFHAMEDVNRPAAITPIFFNQDMELLPSLKAPFLSGRELKPMSFIPPIDSGVLHQNLYPLMGLGLYDRALFQRMRGFDEAILGEYWQVMDYGIRCNLFGNPIFSIGDLAFRFYEKHSIIEDTSECDGMDRCYTRALSIQRIAGKNLVQKWKPYVDRELLKTEVKTKQVMLQKTDFFTLIKEWESGDKDNE